MRAENQPIATPWVVALLTVLCVSCAALLLALPSPFARAACPNEAIRAAQGEAALALPDCRAYELVSPGSQPFTTSDGLVNGTRASTTGSALAYFTRYPAEDAERSGYRYLATRGASGWSVEDALPQDSPTSSVLFDCYQALDFSADLSRSVLSDGWKPPEDGKGGYCKESEDVLAPGAPRGYGNLYLQEGLGSPYQLVNLTPEGTSPANAVLRTYTADLDRILFEEAAPLTEGAPPGESLLYEWAAGTLHLVSVLPDGEPVAGKLADGDVGNNLAPIVHAASDDGESVFFLANGNLYLRKNAAQPAAAGGACSPAEADKACTVQVDLKRGGTGASGGGVFWAATADGSRAFFADESKLTADSNAAAEKPDLYEYNAANGLLKDLTHTGTFERANVSGISGVSEDGSRLYFVARGVLSGSGENFAGDVAQSLSANLYLLDGDGSDIRFVATLDEEEDLPWNVGTMATAVSPSGRYFAFGSVVSLTGFDSTPDNPDDCTTNLGGSLPRPCHEIFLFDAQDGQVECVSCGAVRPVADSRPANPYKFTSKAGGAPVYFARQVFDDGRVFFDTENALVPEDVNGVQDVYQYREGGLELISSGTATGGSAFFDADPSGSNVFFATPQDLVRSDTNNGLSIYDARIGGGFHEPPPAPPCEGESCRGAASTAPAGLAPASLGFLGPEEGPKHPRQRRLRCKRGFVKRHGRCRKKRRHRVRKHKKHRRGGKRHGSKGRSAK